MRRRAPIESETRRSAIALVAHRYELLGELARGGCGAVYEAQDHRLDRRVAIKILRAGALDRAAAARLDREARVAASILHPNVCSVTDSGILDDGSPFLVMDLLHGETLRSYLTRKGALNPEEAIELCVQMLSGLEAAHALGIVHRDMKPENVFVVRPHGGPPIVKLLDFGMCRRNEPERLDDRTLTRAGTVVGTPEYMAPEQASGRREFDRRIDLYAVGVMLYEMLTGTRVFYGPDPRAVLISVLTRPVPSVRSLRPELPAVVDQIVMRAAHRDPRARHNDAAEFQHDLLEARTWLRRQRAASREKRGPGPGPQRRARVDEWEMPTHRLMPGAGYRRPA